MSPGPSTSVIEPPPASIVRSRKPLRIRLRVPRATDVTASEPVFAAISMTGTTGLPPFAASGGTRSESMSARRTRPARRTSALGSAVFISRVHTVAFGSGSKPRADGASRAAPEYQWGHTPPALEPGHPHSLVHRLRPASHPDSDAIRASRGLRSEARGGSRGWRPTDDLRPA